MENIYRMNERMEEIAMRFENAQTALDEAMEENGGELTEETGQMLEELETLEAIKKQIEEDFLNAPDEYAAWYKNVEAKRNAKKAERDAYEAEMKKALAKYDAAVKKQETRMAWIKEQINAAMTIAEVKKLGKKERPESRFSFWYSSSKSIEVDEAMALAAYENMIAEANFSCPEWLQLVPKIVKSALSKAEVLPSGFERKESQNLMIR